MGSFEVTDRSRASVVDHGASDRRLRTLALRSVGRFVGRWVGSRVGSRASRKDQNLSRLGPAVPQARAGFECLRALGVQALASPHSGRFADVSPTLRVRTAPPFRLLAHAGPLGVWQLRCDASEARVASTLSASDHFLDPRIMPKTLPEFKFVERWKNN